MGTRIVVNGQVYWQTPDHYREHPPKEKLPVDKILPVTDDRVIREIAPPFFDDEDGIRYRIASYLDPQQGWCLPQQLIKFYKVPYKIIIHWALLGHLDPAMEMNSPVKRFRVKDHQLLKGLAAKHQEQKKRRRKS